MDGCRDLGKQGKQRQVRVAAFCLCLSLALTTLLTGCTRKFFRKQADREVEHVLSEKDQYDAWRIENYHVYPDPRARFADPTNPDRPPMPPDDPAAWRLAPRPQKARHVGTASVEGTGYLDALAEWDSENRARLGKGPGKEQEVVQASFAVGRKEALPVEPSGYPPARDEPYLIQLEQAVELGLFNSRDYQDRREDLYLAALPVTLQRFSFTAQWLATQTAVRERTGRLTPDGQHNRWRLNNSTGFTRLFPTGALLLFRFANQTVFELTGSNPKHTTSQSTALVELTQPLLRGGGRAVTLEPLTQAERNLVYEIRDYARFRKVFFVSLAAGGGTGGGGVAVLDPATGLTQQVVGGGGVTGSGYLPILLRTAQIANERKNVTAFEGFLKLFNAFKQGGDIGQVNVDQVEQQLLGSRFTVVQRETDYRDALDRFKLQVGVPTNLRLELDDAPIQPMAQQLQKFEQVFAQFDEARKTAESLEALENFLGTQFGRTMVVPVLPQTNALTVLPGVYSRVLTAGVLAQHMRGHLKRIATESQLVRNTQFARDITNRWAAWEQLKDEERVKRLRQFLTTRSRLENNQADLEAEGKPVPADLARRILQLESDIDLGRLEIILKEFEGEPWEKIPDLARRQREHATLFSAVVSLFSKVLGDARLERIERVRQTWAKLPSLCVGDVDLLTAELERAQDVVAQAAVINRLDLMNQRAQLVDAWRKIAVFANSLLGTLNIQYHLDSSTPPGQAKPLAFSGPRSRHQLNITTELPLVRQNERNNYRASLIAYQRSRRAVMQAEDAVVATVRQQVRQLRLLAENYKIQQRLVELAYFQVEQSLETFRQPSTPSGQAGGPPGGGGAGNAAALTNQLLGAQRSLNQAQNQLYQIWVNFQIARMQLYRDLELMPLDFRGVWNDEHATCCGSDTPGSGQQPADPQPAGDREALQPQRLPEPRQLPPAVRTAPQ